MGSICCKIISPRIREEDYPQLISTFDCFVCGKTFKNNIEYNKHITKCRMNIK